MRAPGGRLDSRTNPMLGPLKGAFLRGGVFHPTMNHSPYLERFKRLQGKRIVNIGAGGYDIIPGAVKVDPYRGGADTVKAFGEDLPFEDGSFDLAICAAVLEHVKEPKLIVAEMLRVLKPGGAVYVEIPFMQPYHAAPDDFQRLTIPGLEYLMRDFRKIEVGIVNGPGSGLAWLFVEYLQLFSDRPTLKKILKNVAKVLVFPLKYVDRWLIKKKGAIVGAGGIYFYGEKP